MHFLLNFFLNILNFQSDVITYIWIHSLRKFIFQVLQELAKRCPNLTHLLLDFSQANQLHDFSELSAFPTKLRFLCLCLSDVIFLDNFMKRIYSFINGLEMLHIQGTYEKAEEEEGEVYEVVNIRTLKQATPNLRIINLFGITFIDDTHIEAFSSNCIQLQVRKFWWKRTKKAIKYFAGSLC